MSSTVNAIITSYEPLRTIAAASILTTYQGIGLPFSNPIIGLKVNNDTDQNMRISFDGTTDNDFVPSKGQYVWDYSANKSNQGGVSNQPAGTRVYVKAESSLPTAGTFVYVTVIYNSTV